METMERKITETPEQWTILKMFNGKETYFKVYATWTGGYIGEDRWKMNSGIASVDSDDHFYYFTGASGSCYKCSKNAYGIMDGQYRMTSWNRGTLDTVIKNSPIIIDIMDANTDFEKLLVQD